MLAPFVKRIKTNLDGILQMTELIDGLMMTGDNLANRIIVELYRGTQKVDIDAGDSIVAYAIRNDGYTLEIQGTIEDGNAVVDIPVLAYEIEGPLSFAVRLYSGNTKMVIATATCYVRTTESNSIIDPYHRIPDVQELLSYLEQVEELRATMAQEEVDWSEAEGTRQANETERVRNETTRAANELERIGNEATRESNETSRVSAEETRQAEHEAAVAEIDGMTVSAQRLGYDTNPTADISMVQGHKHIEFGLPIGAPFKITKTFPTVADMMAYTGTDVKFGDFVIIVSDTQDPDNAKLYLKTETSWQFIVDLSGSQGFKGETGNGIDHITMNPDFTLTIYYTDGGQITTDPIRGEKGETGDKGDKGDTGDKGDKGDKGDPGIGGFTINYDTEEDRIDLGLF